MEVLPENGPGRRENSTGRCVGWSCRVHRISLAAAKTAKAFRRADDQAQRPSKAVRCSVSLDDEYELTPIPLRILIAWEKEEEALELPGDVALYARWITYCSCGPAEIGSYRAISGQDAAKSLLPKASALPIPEQTSSNAPGTGTGTTGGVVPLPPLKP